MSLHRAPPTIHTSMSRSGLQTALETLKRCRDQFQLYGDLHLRKDPPQLEKAATNYDLVAEINSAMLAIVPPKMPFIVPTPDPSTNLTPPHLLHRDYVGHPDTIVETQAK